MKLRTAKGANAMRTNNTHFLDRVRQAFERREYHRIRKEYPYFGGAILYLCTKSNRVDGAYFIAKPSTLELVTSDELRLALDYLAGRGVPLRHAVSISQFSAGTHKLAEEAGIELWSP
jgi:hypothetical protein